MQDNYFENILREGKKLSLCVISDKDSWFYFTDLQKRFKFARIHTFQSMKSYLESARRRGKRDNSYKNYDLIVLSSNSPYDIRDQISLEELATAISEHKRVTLGYIFGDPEQELSSYVIESYYKGIKDFNNNGDLDLLATPTEQMVDLIAEEHDKLVKVEYMKGTLIDGGIRERDGYLGEPIWEMPENDSVYYDAQIDGQCTVPSRSLKEIKLELGLITNNNKENGDDK